MRKMGVDGVRVRVTEPENDVLVVLSEAGGDLALPIVIGPHEGVAIATAQAGVTMPRPGTHDLLLTALRAAGSALTSVRITELRGGVFIAALVLANGALVDARASDAIALALRAGVDVWCEDAVLAEAAIVLDADDAEAVPDAVVQVELSGAAGQEQTVAEFRDFLDTIDASAFEDPDEPS